ELQAAGLGYGAWCCAQVRQKQTPQMSRTNPQPLRQGFNAAIFKCALVNQTQSTRDRVRSSHPCGCARRAFRTTSQTRTKPSFCRRCCGREVAHVALLRSSRGTNGPAINSAGQHADEELPIESHITRQTCLRTGFPIQSHRSHPEYAMARKEMDVFGYVSPGPKPP